MYRRKPTCSRAFLCAIAAASTLNCGGGNASSEDAGIETTDADPNLAPSMAAAPRLTIAPTKSFIYDWTDVSGATHYKLLEDPDGTSGFNQVGGDLNPFVQAYELSVPLYARANARYILQSCNAAGCTDSDPISVTGTLAEGVGYIKSDETIAQQRLGRPISIDYSGTVMAVGAPSTGSVYLFSRGASGWRQQALIISSTTPRGLFGNAVSLSSGGETLAIGAVLDNSSATGINGDAADDSAADSGAA